MGNYLETLGQDLRYGVRMLLKNPGVTFVIVVTLALGIGANTTIFSAVDTLMLRPFSFPNQDRLVIIWERNPEFGIRRGSVSPGNLKDWSEQSSTIEEFAAINTRDFDLTGGDRPERFAGYEVSAGFFDTLGVKAALGRTFQRDESGAGREQVVVLKHSLWQRRFGSDPNVLGQVVTLNGKSFTVIGVMPEDFQFPYNGGELWTPLVFDQQAAANRGNHYLQVLGLLKPGVAIEQADAEIRALADRLQQIYPDTNGGRTAAVVSLNADATRGARMGLPIASGAVLFVLLIACANVANLLLIRASSRQKEIAVRLALGATRGRLARQLLTESVLLALAGGALGFVISIWSVELLANSIPEDFSKFIPGWSHFAINRSGLVFTLIMSVFTGILFGLVPAWQATRTNFNDALKEGGKAAAGQASRSWLRSALVVSEVALSLVLLVGAGLMIRSFIEIFRTDFGINPDNVVSMKVALARDKYPEAKQRINFYSELLAGVKASPGVVSAGAINLLPMSGTNQISSFQIAGQPPYPKGSQPLTQTRVVTHEYFAAIGTPLRRGRLFTEQDNEQSSRVILVNEAFASRFLADRDAIGQRIVIDNDHPPEVIGVVANVMNEDLDDPAEPYVYLPYAQNPARSMMLIIRAESDSEQVAAAVRGYVAGLDPDQPISDIKTMTQVIDERSSTKRLMTWVLAIFALIALLLAAVGIYAVISYAVAQRTHEIGIRMALGASPRDIFKLVVGQGATLIIAGVAFGLAGAFALTRVMSEMIFGISATDPVTFTSVSLLLAVVALVACYVPARRATRVDPMEALRHE